MGGARTAPVPVAWEDGKATDFVLDNGMEVVVIPNHRAPILYHTMWLTIG
ncbi:MAG: insulinase family protein, partial [Mesorhizobium sp.]